MPSATVIDAPAATLSVADRCDRCGAQAFAATAHTTTRQMLLWCGHHYTRHEKALLAAGAWQVLDERYRINTSPLASSGTEVDAAGEPPLPGNHRGNRDDR